MSAGASRALWMAVLLGGALGQSGAEQVTVTVQYPNPATFQSAQERLAQRFQTKHSDIRVRFAAPAADYRDMLQRTLRASLSARLPDVAFYDFASAEVLARRRLWPTLSAREQARLRAGAGELWSVGPAERCVPFALSIPVLFVNVELLARTGAAPTDPPESWREVAALSRAAGALPGQPAGIWLPLDRLADWLWQTLLSGRGGRVVDKSGKVVAFRGPAARAAISDYSTLVRSNFYYASSNQAIQGFVGGRLLFLFGSNAVLQRLLAQIGERFRLDMWPVPLTAPSGRWPAGGNCAAILSQDPTSRAAAIDFVGYLLEPAQGRILFDSTGYLPAARSVLEDLKMDSVITPAHARLLAAVREERLVHWRSYPGRRGLRIPEQIRRTLERLALNPALDPMGQLRALDAEVRTIVEHRP